MKFEISNNSPLEIETNWLVVGIFEEAEFSESLQELDEKLEGSLSRVQERKDLTGKLGELTILADVPQLSAERVIVVGLGKHDKLTIGSLSKAYTTAFRHLATKENQSLVIMVPEGASSALGEGHSIERLVDVATVACSRQNIYSTEQDRYEFENVLLCGVSDFEVNQNALEKGLILGEAVNLTRELVNRHPDDLYPETFAQRAADEAADIHLQGEIFDQDMLEDEKMGALLAVSRGSDRPPRMVVLKYNGGGKNAPTIGLVGKGVTFDSGGLSLKTSAGMITMKSDMGGAATVLGAITAIAKLKLKVNVIGVMGLVENMTGGSAYKLGSVLTSRSGKTIEIHNTDAEGRLVLADALAYAVDQKVDKLIDLATLTGACVVALGEDIVGAFTNDQEWCDELKTASQKVNEEVWQLPMHDFFAEQLKSEFADCKNIGSRWGGATTAAKFLEQFVDDVPWVHLDIAGPSYAESSSAHRDSGGTGVMVRALVQLAADSC
ncbi:MAG: leucyl aminopeptidase [Planctomicrobium sp.]|jgi:leucyl aminopeptidase|nr:leucyl aminopeptidase [Planctomicrobium sp.]